MTSNTVFPVEPANAYSYDTPAYSVKQYTEVGYKNGGDFVIDDGTYTQQNPNVELVNYVNPAPQYTSMVGMPIYDDMPGPSVANSDSVGGDAMVTTTLCIVGAGAAMYQLFKTNFQKEGQS